jgi:hypothetical protein
VLALIKDASVPREAESLEGLQDIVGSAWRFAWRIDVFDANEPLAACLPGVQEAGHCCDQRTEV